MSSTVSPCAAFQSVQDPVLKSALHVGLEVARGAERPDKTIVKLVRPVLEALIKADPKTLIGVSATELCASVVALLAQAGEALQAHPDLLADLEPGVSQRCGRSLSTLALHLRNGPADHDRLRHVTDLYTPKILLA